MKSIRLQLVLPVWLKDALKEASKIKGISMAEYIKDAVKERLDKDADSNKQEK